MLPPEIAEQEAGFMSLANRFGRVAASFSDLLEFLLVQLNEPDRLSIADSLVLGEIFYKEHNGTEHCAADLIRILNDNPSADHWITASAP